jgi:zinc transport system substrate-binding protein
MYDFARQIGGDEVDVYSMCPVGTEPHDYEPKTTDMAKLSESDVFIYNGHGMESWAEKTASTLKNVKVVCASEGIDADNKNDPHIWLDPENALKEAENIKNAFVEADSSHSEIYEKNYRVFEEKIKELDEEYSSVISGKENKTVVVAHSAYGYLCDAYGLEQIAVENSQGEEPSPTRMAEIVDIMREKGIKHICAEELESSKVIESIANETGASISTLNPFEGDIEAKDYFEVMRNNLEVLKEIL